MRDVSTASPHHKETGSDLVERKGYVSAENTQRLNCVG